MLQEGTRFVRRGYITFPLRSRLVPRSTLGDRLGVKHSTKTPAPELLLDREFWGLTSIPSGLICKESSGGRLKLDGQAVTHAFRDNLSAQLGLWPGFKLHMLNTC